MQKDVIITCVLEHIDSADQYQRHFCQKDNCWWVKW